MLMLSQSFYIFWHYLVCLVLIHNWTEYLLPQKGVEEELQAESAVTAESAQEVKSEKKTKKDKKKKVTLFFI